VAIVIFLSYWFFTYYEFYPHLLSCPCMSDCSILSRYNRSCFCRVDDEEIKRFWFASKEDTVRFVTMMQKTLKWRQSYNFMSSLELRAWSPLVFWHLQDAHGRPILIIRLGLVCSTTTPAQRPQFAQAVSMCSTSLSLCPKPCL